MRPDARGAAMEAALKAEQTSGGERARKTDRNVDDVVRQRDLSMARQIIRRMLALFFRAAAAITSRSRPFECFRYYHGLVPRLQERP